VLACVLAQLGLIVLFSLLPHVSVVCGAVRFCLGWWSESQFTGSKQPFLHWGTRGPFSGFVLILTGRPLSRPINLLLPWHGKVASGGWHRMLGGSSETSPTWTSHSVWDACSCNCVHGCMQLCRRMHYTSNTPVCHLPYEPSLARALVAHERAVRRGPDPV
jgi:hypothetical protein